jgi:uncharacterized repeat protein (TIGR01451 family)
VGDKTTTTDAAGNWEIRGFFEGKYDVFATKDNFSCLQSEVELGNQEYLTAVNCKPVTTLTVVANPHTWGALKQGEELTYTITVINGGKDTATGVTVTETVPVGSELVSFEALDGGVCDANTLSCTLPNLTPGATAKLKLVLRATAGKNLKNVLTVTSNEYPVEVQTRWKAVKPHLSVTVIDTPNPVTMLGTLHYTAQVELSANAPQPTATGVNLTMQLPQGVKLETVKTDQGTCDSTQLPLITCQLADLSIATPDRQSVATVNLDVKLEDAGLLVLTQDAKVTAKEYPAHEVKTRTPIFVPKDLKVDAILVLDTTHSMQGELNGVKATLAEFIQQIDPSTSPTIALVGFKDDVKVLAFTKDLPLLQTVIAGLKAEGGGLCPEASVEALNVALDHVKDNGVIFFSTDASPYDDADVDTLVARLKTQLVKLNAVVTGDCTSEGDWNEMTK